MYFMNAPKDAATLQQERLSALQAYRESVEGEREMYERGLQQDEQKRRQYDSETQRSKYGLLSNLLKGAFGGGGYGSGPSGSVTKSVRFVSRPFATRPPIGRPLGGLRQQ